MIYITESQNISDEDFFMLKKAVYDDSKLAGICGKPRTSRPRLTSLDKAADPASNPLRRQLLLLILSLRLNRHKLNSDNFCIHCCCCSVIYRRDQCRLADQCRNNPKMAEAYPDVKFGNKPSRSTPYCLACDYEEECRVATEKIRKPLELNRYMV
jgi:hypothetical protein